MRRRSDLKRSMLYCTNRVLTVNFNSTLRCDVVNGFLMQTKATWDQAGLCLMQCFVVILLILHCYHMLCCGVMMDADGNTQSLCECKVLNMFVSVCLLFKVYAPLSNVTCYSNCICICKCICKGKQRYHSVTIHFSCCFFFS